MFFYHLLPWQKMAHDFFHFFISFCHICSNLQMCQCWLCFNFDLGSIHWEFLWIFSQWSGTTQSFQKFCYKSREKVEIFLDFLFQITSWCQYIFLESYETLKNLINNWLDLWDIYSPKNCEIHKSLRKISAALLKNSLSISKKVSWVVIFLCQAINQTWESAYFFSSL